MVYVNLPISGEFWWLYVWIYVNIPYIEFLGLEFIHDVLLSMSVFLTHVNVSSDTILYTVDVICIYQQYSSVGQCFHLNSATVSWSRAKKGLLFPLDVPWNKLNLCHLGVGGPGFKANFVPNHRFTLYIIGLNKKVLRPQKTNMTTEKKPFEDVSPIKTW